MRLQRHPRRPDSAPAIRITVGLRNAPESWRDYLYWNSSWTNLSRIANPMSTIPSESPFRLDVMPDDVPVVTSVVPERAVGRGRVTIHGSGFAASTARPTVRSAMSPRASRLPRAAGSSSPIPDEMDGGRDAGPARRRHPRRTSRSERSGRPVFTRSTTRSSTRDGNLFVTYSGSRGQEAPVSIFRVTPRARASRSSSGIVNATSMAFGPDGQLYVSSRFEGAVYRVADDGTPEQVASDLGVACGIAFDTTDGCTSAIDRGRSSACATGARRRSRRCRRASPRFTLR